MYTHTHQHAWDFSMMPKPQVGVKSRAHRPAGRCAESEQVGTAGGNDWEGRSGDVCFPSFWKSPGHEGVLNFLHFFASLRGDRPAGNFCCYVSTRMLFDRAENEGVL